MWIPWHVKESNVRTDGTLARTFIGILVLMTVGPSPLLDSISDISWRTVHGISIASLTAVDELMA